MCSIPFVQAEWFSTGNPSVDLLGPEISTDMSRCDTRLTPTDQRAILELPRWNRV
jgi:hypothetical protein